MILIVDACQANGLLLRRLLRVRGHDTEAIFSGTSALQFCLDHGRPRLFILDYTMAEMDGLELLRRIGSDPALHNVPVVFFSAVSDSHVQQVASDLGARGWVEKGANQDSKLMAHIDAVMTS